MVLTVGGQVLATVPLIDPATIDPSISFAGRVAATAFEQTGPVRGRVGRRGRRGRRTVRLAGGRRMSRRGQSSADEIEFLEPRDFAFGGEDAADFSGVDIDDMPDADDSTPRSRWLTTAAGVVLAGMVVRRHRGRRAVGLAQRHVGASADHHPAARATPGTCGHRAGDTPNVVPDAVRQRSGRGSERRGQPVTGMVFDPLPPGFAITCAWNQVGGSGDEADPRLGRGVGDARRDTVERFVVLADAAQRRRSRCSPSSPPESISAAGSDSSSNDPTR